MRSRVLLLVFLLTLARGVFVVASRQNREEIGILPDGSALVPTSQRISPVGETRLIPNDRPKDMAVAPDGSKVAVLCPGRIVVYGTDSAAPVTLARGGGPLGIAWSRDSKRLYFSAGAKAVECAVEQGQIRVLREIVLEASADRPKGLPADPQASGLALLADGQTLAVALGTRNVLAIVDLPSGTVKARVPVDVCPYHVAVQPDGRRVWVSCRGGEAEGRRRTSALTAGIGVRIDPRTDAVCQGTVVVVDTETGTTARVKVGRQPSGLCFRDDGTYAYVTNSDDDTVSVIDVRKLRVVASLTVRAAEGTVFGHMPTSVTLTEDKRTLYVSCGGINAVAVVPLDGDGLPSVKSPAGYIPTGWFPVAVAWTDDALWIASAKGMGSRGDKRQGGFWVHASTGTVQKVRRQDMEHLAQWTEQVAANNRWGDDLPPRRGIVPVPVPERVGEPSVFKHVVYVIKENHTYDVTLGDMPEGNGDPKLCLFGEEVTPNQHAIAREFVLLDNTYTSGTNSADGHQWTSASLCNAYMEQNYSSYARSYPYDGGDALAYSPQGFLWTAAARKRLWVRVFGEFVNRPRIVDRKDPQRRGRPSWSELWNDYRTGSGRFQIFAETDNAALRPHLHPHAIGFPMNVSDQWRADQFLSDLREWERRGRMPALSIILLPNDHTAGTTPGMPTPRACVADNDLAFGRIVDALSHSRFWSETLILCIEDDSQLGVDHVDGHRTLAYCVSPYTRRRAVVSRMYDHTGIVRTIELVLGIPAMNRFDRAGRPLRECFTSTADLTPYVHRPNRVPLDELNKSATTLRGEARHLAVASSRLDWSDVDRADAEVVARAVWLAQRPGRPFPRHLFRPPEDAE